MKENYLLVKVESGNYKLITFDEILYVSTDSKYLRLFTISNEFKVRASISQILKRLPQIFMRVHNSFIVNLQHLESKQDSFQECNVGSKNIPIGLSYRRTIKNKISVFE